MGEIGIEARYAGQGDVPLVLVQGDEAGCREAEAQFPDVLTAPVKRAVHAELATGLTPAEGRRLTARRVVDALHVHRRPPVTGVTGDARPLAESVPSAFLDRFLRPRGRAGMAGKQSIVPSSSYRGDVVRGFAGDPAGTRARLDTARRRLGGRSDCSPRSPCAG